MSVSALSGRPSEDIESLGRKAKSCEACPLWKDATQTVFGEGPADAKIMFVGEQPGDREDREGRPFVGPAGQLLDQALAVAGVDRERPDLMDAAPLASRSSVLAPLIVVPPVNVFVAANVTSPPPSTATAPAPALPAVPPEPV